VAADGHVAVGDGRGDMPTATAAAVAPREARNNGAAIASAALGLANWLTIVSTFSGFASFKFRFGVLLAIPAIVFGHMARRQIRRTGERGRGLALTGLILGWATVTLAIAIIAIIAIVLG
jgi:hypothetical protein